MCEIFDSIVITCAKERLIEMAESFARDFKPEISSDIIIRFYLGTDGRPSKYKELGSETGLGRVQIQRIIRLFRDFVEKKGRAAVFTLKLFETYREYYWKEWKRRNRKKQ